MYFCRNLNDCEMTKMYFECVGGAYKIKSYIVNSDEPDVYFNFVNDFYNHQWCIISNQLQQLVPNTRICVDFHDVKTQRTMANWTKPLCKSFGVCLTIRNEEVFAIFGLYNMKTGTIVPFDFLEDRCFLFYLSYCNEDEVSMESVKLLKNNNPVKKGGL